MSDLYTRTETVEAHQWMPADPISAGRTLGWLLAHGVEFTHTRGPEATLTLTPDSVALVAHPGDWVVHHPRRGLSVLTNADFEADYAPAGAPRGRRGVTNVINGVTAGGSIIQSGGDIRF
ncbi:hypothetical protein [Nocardiopsis sp. MG754419]|uniref:hypothetical protein n=1 Tax=Nocardiopsis sp. MG754419 TaxID=2259865 RepID=UPI001BADADF9|nr:hypothetical protein [Nocardiopsis sp. MG754419]MBR8745307.1 hypothetical protein [Nocardiopsis sp. MG754419]